MPREGGVLLEDEDGAGIVRQVQQVRSVAGVAFDPLKFLREVRAETGRVTFPSRRETAVTTGLVILMAAAAAAFFFIADQAFSAAIRALFGFGG